MKNDSLDAELAEALDDIDTEIHDLRTVGWIMSCIADPAEKPPAGLFPADLGYFMAKLIARHAERLGNITRPAQDKLRERRQASR
jgi:hypothetical protein